MMSKKVAFFLLLLQVALCATELLQPVTHPKTSFLLQGAAELDDDIYSGDMDFAIEASPVKWASLYINGAFRFLSYSYEYSTKGYIHNYCNLHVNGFNETYLGAKSSLFKNFGVDLGWQIPPGEGSSKSRFHRFNFEPYAIYNFSKNLALGGTLRYLKFLENSNYKPGDQVGIKGSLQWKCWWNDTRRTGWQFSEIALYQWRLQDSKNYNLKKPYQKMDDCYRGLKFKFDAARYFNIWGSPIAFGINYEIQQGTLFGFETGHRLGLYGMWIR